MFTIDLKQILDYLGIKHFSDLGINAPENEHDALCDAKWNLNLFKTIKHKYRNRYLKGNNYEKFF
jgi:hypothetical protein